MKRNPPRPVRKRRPPGGLTLLALVAAIAYLATMNRGDVTQWVKRMVPSIPALQAPYTEAKAPASAPAPLAYAPAAAPTAAPGTVDECSAFGRDTSAYQVCLDHKRKVQASQAAAKRREEVFYPPQPAVKDGQTPPAGDAATSGK